ncbi:MAG: MFS transporter [bacterium]|nr:MFS transporter [bacterium]
MTESLEPTPDGSHTEIAQTVSAILLCVAGTTMYLILPLFVGVAAEHVGLSDRQVGLLASVEIAGIGLASLLAVSWQHRVSWRLAAVVSLVFIVAGDLLSIGATSAGSLLTLRFFTGLLGEGPAYALGLACLGEEREPDRVFLKLTASQVAYAATALWGLPYAVSSWGFPGMLIVFALIAALVIPFARYLPRKSRKVSSAPRAATSRPQGSRLALVALVFHMVFFTGVGSIWTYVERMGSSSGLATEQVGLALAVSTAISFVGLLLASRIGDRFGRRLPYVLAGIGLGAAAVFLALPLSLLGFIAATALFSVFWNIGGAFQLGLATELDTHGRFLVLVPAFQAAGNTLGPALAASLLSGQGYLPANWLGGLCCVTSFAVFFFLAGRASPGQRIPTQRKRSN